MSLTGSLGVLIRAKREGYPILLSKAISKMQSHGIRLSDRLIALALKQAGE